MKIFKLLFLLSLILAGGLPAGFVFAANPLDVVINEIAWMGTEISHNDEWIELYNNTDSPINLEGWTLKAADRTPDINFAGTVLAKSFYLLERTDDNSVLGIPADQIYRGALKNEGENLELRDNFGNLIDSVNCSDGWFAGDNQTKQTMERKNSLLTSDVNNWGTSQNPGGTPMVENSSLPEYSENGSRNIDELTEEPQSEPESEPKPEPKPEFQPAEEFVEIKPQQINYPSGIIINEILPSPTGPDAEEEWIEIFNRNNFEVSLSGWQITDSIGQTKTYTFPKDALIKPKGYLVLHRPVSKITLNNSNDGLKLIQPDANIIDVVNYEKARQGESFNLILLESSPLTGQAKSNWVWSTIPTPGSTNIIPTEESSLETEIIGAEKQLLAVSKPFQHTKDKQVSSTIFLIASVLAIFSGTIILTLKNKIKPKQSKIDF